MLSIYREHIHCKKAVMNIRVRKNKVNVSKGGMMRKYVVGGSVRHLVLGSSSIPVDKDDTNLEQLKQSLKKLSLGPKKGQRKFINF